ncbi:MAG: carbamoyltransferase [Actinomycetota bacterium]|nr:carbamoyltransferase [Actinomycetota bacterium]
MHTENEPVVVLSGRAELGPRALGNRSILAPATDPAMKARLNAIKNRADYRPVVPICLVDRAEEVFVPGNT